MADPRDYQATETLKDGAPITIRAIRQDDRARIVDAFSALDSGAVYRRFFSPKKSLTDAELKQLTDVDFSQVVALVVVASQEDDGKLLIGGGRYAAEPGEHPRRAELAFLISEAYRGRGIGSLLLRHLARIAKDAGITELEADVLAENAPMLAVFQRSELPLRRQHEGNVVHITLSLNSPQAS
jgi:RimJ/RimL family protein N-acetyltransferase